MMHVMQEQIDACDAKLSVYSVELATNCNYLLKNIYIDYRLLNHIELMF